MLKDQWLKLLTINIIILVDKYLFLVYLRWNNGENHLLFNMISNLDESDSLPTGLAMLANSGLNYKIHRRQFDISIPFYSAEIGQMTSSRISPG